MPLPPKLCEIMAAHADGQPKGWNRRICEEMGFGTSEWCRWMKGKHQPNADTVVKILWKLGELENFKPDENNETPKV